VSLRRPCRSCSCRHLPPFSFFSFSGISRDNYIVRAVGEREIRVEIKIRKNLSPIKLGDTDTLCNALFRHPAFEIRTPFMPKIVGRRDVTSFTRLAPAVGLTPGSDSRPPIMYEKLWRLLDACNPHKGPARHQKIMESSYSLTNNK
jgi:hypothetical protein